MYSDDSSAASTSFSSSSESSASSWSSLLLRESSYFNQMSKELSTLDEVHQEENSKNLAGRTEYNKQLL